MRQTIKGFFSKVRDLLRDNSLWIAGVAIMLASSGVDGTYLSKWQPDGWGWLGYVLNTSADLATEILMYWYGVYRRNNAKGTKKYRMARVILVFDLVLAWFSWFFGWRQLIPIMDDIELEKRSLIAGISASFAPVTLMAIGYCQSLLHVKDDGAPKSRNDGATGASTAQNDADDAPMTREPDASGVNEVRTALNKPDFTRWLASLNGDRATVTRDVVFTWAAGAGADVKDTYWRDKINRWCREAEIDA